MAGEIENWDKILSYYVITNNDGNGTFGPEKLTNANFSWRTAKTAEDGTPLHPNGIYTIAVRAYDAMGNVQSATDSVLVTN